MNTYIITNKKDNERYIKTFNTIEDAKHWVINYLDLTKCWAIVKSDKI